jgi:hypothetical protein
MLNRTLVSRGSPPRLGAPASHHGPHSFTSTNAQDRGYAPVLRNTSGDSPEAIRHQVPGTVPGY